MTPISRRTLLGTAPLLGVGGLVGIGTTAAGAPDAEAASARPLHIGLWDRANRFDDGVRGAGLKIDSRGGLVLTTGTRKHTYDDPFGPARSYDYGNWTSQRITPRFGATELIASWSASTPTGTWVEIAVQARTTSGRTTRWYIMGRWASGDGGFPTSSGPRFSGQSDAYASVSTDTLVLKSGYRLASYVVRATLFRRSGTTVTPRVGLIAAIASALPKVTSVKVSPKGGAQGKVLAVPTYSQERHRGHYPQWDGGGEAWCSATSTAMVLDYWRLGPPASTTAWVKIKGETRPQVDHLARCVYDYTYQGTGNWPFNTAYAGSPRPPGRTSPGCARSTRPSSSSRPGSR